MSFIFLFSFIFVISHFYSPSYFSFLFLFSFPVLIFPLISPLQLRIMQSDIMRPLGSPHLKLGSISILALATIITTIRSSTLMMMIIIIMVCIVFLIQSRMCRGCNCNKGEMSPWALTGLAPWHQTQLQLSQPFFATFGEVLLTKSIFIFKCLPSGGPVFMKS